MSALACHLQMKVEAHEKLTLPEVHHGRYADQGAHLVVDRFSGRK